MIAALLLADGRFPAGGHAHSGGMEPAIAIGTVQDLTTLEQFLTGRLFTAGVSAAALAGAACSGVHRWEDLDAESEVRTPSPALRASSRRQGRQLVRASLALWPGEILEDLHRTIPDGPHHPVALGGAAAAAGLDPFDAARCAIYSAVSGPAGAAVKLLGLDPLAVHSLMARLTPAMERAALAAAGFAEGPLRTLPCPGSPLLDLYAENHVLAQMRLFAS